MRSSLYLFSFVCMAALSQAQIQTVDITNKKGNNTGMHWVKTTFYKPKAGSTEADKSKIPDIYMHPNQLTEYNKEGRVMAIMDYKRGSNEESGATMHYYWNGALLLKQVQENDAYDAMYTYAFTYDAAGYEIKKETKAGPGDKFGITSDGYTESTWTNGRLVKFVSRTAKGGLLSEETYTYDAKGNKTREDYYPVSLYAAKTFTYDAKGNVLTETYLDKEGKPSTVWTNEYNSAGLVVNNTMSHYYKGAKDDEEVTTYTYDAKGGCTSKIIKKEGKVTGNYSWKHDYDAKGKRIQTVHFKDGKAEMVEVLEIRYY